MAVHTVQLRDIVESKTPVFDFPYPIFDESYRPVLEEKIINRYLFREIGLETVAMFKHFLKTKLNEIMPYYNEMYESTLIEYNPLHNLDTTEKSSRNSTGTGENESLQVGDSNSKHVFHDTPQGRVLNNDYATTIDDTDGAFNNKNNDKSSVRSTEEYINRVTGSGGMRYPADIIIEWRKSFINVDTMILDELEGLFMSIY